MRSSRFCADIYSSAVVARRPIVPVLGHEQRQAGSAMATTLGAHRIPIHTDPPLFVNVVHGAAARAAFRASETSLPTAGVCFTTADNWASLVPLLPSVLRRPAFFFFFFFIILFWQGESVQARFHICLCVGTAMTISLSSLRCSCCG